MRALWAVMDKFNVLPTDERFRNLSDYQMEMIFLSMEEDARQQNLRAKGLTVESDYFDSSYEDEVANKPDGEWEILKEGHDADDIARQVEEMTNAEELKKLYSKFEGLEEYNQYREEGGQTGREMQVSEYIKRQIEKAKERAREKEQGIVRDVDKPERPVVAKKNTEKNDKVIDEVMEMFESEEDEYTEL